MLRRILCLHGRRQSGKKFADKLFEHDIASGNGGICATSSPTLTTLRRVLDDGLTLEFVFPTAPHTEAANILKTAKSRTDCGERDLTSWWTGDNKSCEGLSKSLAHLDALRRTFDEETFDAVVGFSQGGALASRLISELRWKREPLGVFISSYASDCPPSASSTTTTTTTTGASVNFRSTLHVYGDVDQLVKPESSRKLFERVVEADAHSRRRTPAAVAEPLLIEGGGTVNPPSSSSEPSLVSFSSPTETQYRIVHTSEGQRHALVEIKNHGHAIPSIGGEIVRWLRGR